MFLLSICVVGLILYKIKTGISEDRRAYADAKVRIHLNGYLFADPVTENGIETSESLEPLLSHLYNQLFLGKNVRTSLRRRSLRHIALELTSEVIGETRVRLTFLFEYFAFVNETMESMTDRRWWIRAEGCRDAGLMRSERALPYLERCLDDPNEDVRIEAAQSMIDIAGVEALSAILMRLKDLSHWMKTRISRSILAFGGDAVPHLAAGIRSEYPKVQGFCIDLLGQIGDVSALSTLLEYINFEVPEVQQKSLIAFGRIGDRRAVPIIQKFMQSDNRDVRYAAVKAAVNLSSPSIASDLLNQLLKDDLDIKLVAAEALSRSGETGVKSLLYACRFNDERVRLIAHQFLHDLGVPIPQGEGTA